MRTLVLFVACMAITFLKTLSVSSAQAASSAPPSIMNAEYLRRHAETRGFLLGRPVQAKPTPDGQAVLFLRAEARVPKLKLYEFEVASGQTRELITPEQVLKGAEEQLSAEEKARRERMRVSVGGFTSFQLTDDGAKILLSLSGRLYVMDRKSRQIQELKTGAGTMLDSKFSPDGRKVSYVRDYDVYVFDLQSQREQRITTGGSERVSHGLAEFVAQEEMNRFSGYWWSPDSKSIAYQESDASDVKIWHVSDPAKPEQEPHASFYPRPGKNNVRVRLGVVSIRSGKTTWIQWDAQRYPYLATVKWEKNAPLTLAVQSREQQELALLTADTRSGRTKVLLTETDGAFLNLDQQMPRWLEDGSGFFWTSEREGGPQLEWRSATGELKQVLVPSKQGYQSFLHFDAVSKLAHVQLSPDPTQAHLASVSIESGAIRIVTRDAGQHSATFSKNHTLLVRHSVTPKSMPATAVLRADGTLIGTLPSVAEEPPFQSTGEIVRVGSGDGFYTKIIRPRTFDAARKYPVLNYVYGGPHARMVQAALPGDLLKQWLADQGFIVVSIDNRGTPGRGREWERAIYKKFGSVPLDDQVSGMKALGERFPELDLDRVGIVGWSFGGYMSALAVLRRPDVFLAAVAGAPVVDWLDYDTHYTERYLGLPQAAPEAYREGSLLTYAADLKRPLLLVHGTSDDNVFFRHTLKLADALFRNGKYFEVLPLSSLTHMVPDPVVTEQLWTRTVLHFKKHLGEPAIR
ncbi:MAG: DPP IV N-terminal domain-containing protein [Verrucomicrobiota bacterium]